MKDLKDRIESVILDVMKAALTNLETNTACCLKFQEAIEYGFIKDFGTAELVSFAMDSTDAGYFTIKFCPFCSKDLRLFVKEAEEVSDG